MEKVRVQIPAEIYEALKKAADVKYLSPTAYLTSLLSEALEVSKKPEIVAPVSKIVLSDWERDWGVNAVVEPKVVREYEPPARINLNPPGHVIPDWEPLAPLWDDE